jgi:alpha-glucoside transport system substrate-binding protein
MERTIQDLRKPSKKLIMTTLSHSLSRQQLSRSSRCILALLLSAFAGTSLVACGASTEEKTPTVTIIGSLTGVGQENIEAALKPFTEETGIQVIYEGTDAFTTVLPIRVEGGNPPDIALFPQPGLMKDLVQEQALVPLDGILDPTALNQAYSPDWIKLATIDAKLYGVWMRADPKSLVWYNPQAFASKGYTVPKTWADLISLTQKIAADGQTPWCIGMESGDATGWVGTDWVEALLLSESGPAVYDDWVSHKLPFSSAPVRQAFEKFAQIALNPQYVLGGKTGIISTPFGDSVAPLFDDPPGCYLHRQASFLVDFLPEKAVPGETVGVFALPPVSAQQGNPMITGGILFGMLQDSPEAQKLMQYLATATPHEIWAGVGYITPHKGVKPEAYPNDLIRQQAEILATAQPIRFDGSDLMPAAVGTGSFWRIMVDYVNGKDLDTTLKEIDDSWPKAE